ncbi:class I SAM-dependent methyltransferase [Microbacterium lacticum]
MVRWRTVSEPPRRRTNRARPDSPAEAVAWLLEPAGDHPRIVDIGAGTGKLTRVVTERPGGVLGLIWNIRDESEPWVGRLGTIMKGSHAQQLLAEGGPEVAAPFGELEERTWHWERPMTRAALTAMVHSRSYVITAVAGERARIDDEIAALFDEVGAVGDATVSLPYVTHAFRALNP